jgi:hypothetical protein
MESRRASWLIPALILLTTFLAPMAYVDVQYVSQVREIWLLFPWQPFMLWTNRVIFYPGFPPWFPSDSDLVHELVLVWVAIGAVLSLVFPRDLEEFRHSISLRLSLIFLVMQMVLPFPFLSMANYSFISSYIIVPLPIPSAISLVALFYVSRNPSGHSEDAGQN